MGVKRVEEVEVEAVSAGTGVTRQVLIGAGEGPHFAMRKFTIAPGGSMPLHTNTVEHEQYVLAGRARVRIGAEAFDVGPGAVVLIPAGAPHDYRVVGEEAFAFLCLVPNAPEDVVSIVEDDDAAPGGC